MVNATVVGSWLLTVSFAVIITAIQRNILNTKH